jgi:Holliday junction resolvase-like predicted endonuclease
MSGEQFERHCAELLENRGWRVSSTSRSRDRGVDLIARKNKTCVVIQCKQQSSPVGISAVREARLAKDVVNADYAVVASSRDSFTLDAKKAADSGNVLLVPSAELGALEARIRRLNSHSSVNPTMVTAGILALLTFLALIPQQIRIPLDTRVTINPQTGVFWLPRCNRQYADFGLPTTSLQYAQMQQYHLASSCVWPKQSALVSLANDFSSWIAKAL